jgi:hypothetical protein
MGLFKSKEERAEKAQDRAMKAAEKAEELRQKNTDKVLSKAAGYGLSTEGVEAALYNFKEGDHLFLFVYPDRVEYKVLSGMMKMPKDSKTIPLDKISSVSVDKEGFVSHTLNVYTSGTAISFPDQWDLAPSVAAKIQTLL